MQPIAEESDSEWEMEALESYDNEYYSEEPEDKLLSMRIEDPKDEPTEKDEDNKTRLMIGNTKAQMDTTDKVKLRKVELKVKKEPQWRPPTNVEEKQCLSSLIKINGIQAWALWDLGSTMTGMTPSFAQVANIKVHRLTDPHILQLGTIGSKSSINYGAQVDIEIPGYQGNEYMDLANFDRYDVVIGTPFMTRNKVNLNFETGKITVNGRDFDTLKTGDKDVDMRLRRWRTTRRYKE